MKINNSLFFKTFFIIIVSLGFVNSFFIYSLIQNQKEALYDSIYSQAKTIADSIKLMTEDAMIVGDYSFIVEHSIKVLEHTDELEYLLIEEKSGTKIYTDRDNWKILEKVPSKISKLHQDTIVSNILPNSFTKKEVFHLSYPIVFSGVRWGWIDMGLSLLEYDKQMKIIYKNFVIIFFLIFILSITFSYYFTRWLIKPVERLNEASKQIAMGKFDIELNSDRNDEIGELTHSFNQMAITLKEYTNELEVSKLELEKRVQERTKELQILNEELDLRVQKESLKRAEQEQILVQQSRHAAMGEMIGNIAHQWRQPLNAMGLLLQNIENAYEMDMLNEKFIRRIIEKGNNLTQNMSKTIDDFRNFFKSNKIKNKFYFYEAYQTTKDIVSSSFKNNNINLIEEIDKSVYVVGYNNEFSQVILNILNNAKDALIEKDINDKKIIIKIYEKDDMSYINIVDNAGGIPQDYIQKVFDPYFTTKEEGKGTGIGLYMSKTIIESNMKGKLKVENIENGASFTISLPKEI